MVGGLKEGIDLLK